MAGYSRLGNAWVPLDMFRWPFPSYYVVLSAETLVAEREMGPLLPLREEAKLGPTGLVVVP